jgi:hypothetical protein
MTKVLTYLQGYLCRTVQRSQYLSFPILFPSFVYYLHQCYLQNLPYISHPIFSVSHDKLLHYYFISVGRINKDSDKNHYGSRLLDLCKGNDLFIINGRIGNDKGIGKLTCFCSITYIFSDHYLIFIFTFQWQRYWWMYIGK